ncbi:hypothetical protein DPEC_G00311000 [Dallia pectoralis]|uniref:Uncharacterized protein n=1 Tax=Dallia pectoralis TaxID=75939 RepID=A0ACC2FBH6_DALPE|nr:hypothetical protein DPEC_G00311000 [Dallia pectoralis]
MVKRDKVTPNEHAPSEGSESWYSHSEDEELIDEDYTPRTLSTDGDREEESPAPGNIDYQGYPPLPSFSSSPTSSDASAQAGGLKRRLPFPSERTEKRKMRSKLHPWNVSSHNTSI